MTFVGLLHGLQHILIHSEGESAEQSKQKRVRNHGDDREGGQGEENDQTDT